MKEEKSPYSEPEIYELAFSWRDYPRAVDFIIEAAARAGRPQPGSMVELGCGPGQYCREFARREVKSFGVDLSPEMVRYASEKCTEEKLNCEIIEADFRAFKLPARVDLAVCMMNTFTYLLTNRDIIDHLGAVADCLNPDGLYLIELSHPRDLFSTVKSANNVWEMERENLKLEIDWCSDAVFDPLTEIDQGTVKINCLKDNETKLIKSIEQSRRIGLGLIRSLIELSERFKIASMYGDLDINQTFDNRKESWRMILLLRKY